jgi:hypothetical protein
MMIYLRRTLENQFIVIPNETPLLSTRLFHHFKQKKTVKGQIERISILRLIL